MANFIKNFIADHMKGALEGELSNVVGIQNIVSSAMGKANEVRNDLTSKVQFYREIIPAFLMNQEIPYLDNYETSMNTVGPLDLVAEIDEEVKNTIISSIQNAVSYRDNLPSSYEGKYSIAVSDSKGYFYNFCIVDETFEYDGVEYTCYLVNGNEDTSDFSIDNAIVYKNNSTNTYYLNYRVKVFSDTVIPTPIQHSTIQSCWISIQNLLNLNITSVISQESLFDIARKWLFYFGKSYYEFTDIEDAYKVIFRQLGSIYLNNLSILENSQALYEHLISGYAIINRFSHLGDVLRDMSISDTVNNLLLDGLNAVVGDHFDIAALVSDLSNKYGTLRDVISIINGIREAYNRGNRMGVILFIMNILEKQAGVTIEDGRLVFTDNSSLIPESYASGILSQAISTIGSVVGGILTMVKPAIGAIVMAISSAISVVSKLVTYQGDKDTLAQVNNSYSNLVLPYAPYGLCQFELNVDFRLQPYFKLVEDIGVFYLDVPGGALFIGKGIMPNSLAIEFHPAICKYDRTVFGFKESFSNKYDSAGEWVYHSDNDVVSASSNNITILHYTADTNYFTLTPAKLIDLWNTRAPLNGIATIEDGQDILSPKDDQRVQSAIITSLSIFIHYIKLLNHEHGLVFDLRNYQAAVCYYGNEDRWQRPYFITRSFQTSVFGYINDEYNDSAMFPLWPNMNMLLQMAIINDPYFSEDSCSKKGRWKEISATCLESMSWTQLSKLITNYNIDDFTHYTGLPDWIDIFNHEVAAPQWYFGNVCLASKQNLNTTIKTYSLPIMDGVKYLLTNSQYYGQPQSINGSISWLVTIPKYDRRTYMMQAIAVSVGIVLAVAATITIALVVRSKIKTTRMKKNLEMERSWQRALEDPSSSNIHDYKVSVFKSNLFSRVTGGTIYSKESYWQSEGSDSSNASNNSNVLASLWSDFGDQNKINEDLAPAESTPVINRNIYQRITGQSFS